MYFIVRDIHHVVKVTVHTKRGALGVKELQGKGFLPGQAEQYIRTVNQLDLADYACRVSGGR